MSVIRQTYMILAASDEEVEARLPSLTYGVPREFIFLLPPITKDFGSLMIWHPEVGLRYLIIEDGSLAKGCYFYLLRRGARQFASMAEASQAAKVEQWPGWETCDQFTRGFSVLRKNIDP